MPTAATAGRPVVATAGDGSVTVLARRPDGGVYRRVRSAGTGEWGDWTDTLGAAIGDPAVSHDLNGRLEVFVHGTNDHLWRQVETKSGSWGPWLDMGTPPNTTVAGNPVVVADDNTASLPKPDQQGHVQGNTDGRQELFVRGGDGGLWHIVQRAPNGTAWSLWEQVGGTVAGDPAAVVGGDGRIALFARGADGHLRHSAQTHPGTQQTPLPAGNWATWADLGGGFTDNVAVGTATISSGTLLQVFGNHADGRLWTVTQSQPGTSANPTGTWDLAHKFNLGPALIGAPVVATNTDGRLAVFGVDATHLVTYRSQTNAIVPGTDPNGIWAGGWARLTRQKVGSVTVRPPSQSGFEVFAVGDGSATLYQRGQLAAGTATTPEGSWLDWTDLAPIGSGRCDGPGTLNCLNITNADLGLAVDLQDTADATSYIVRSAPDQTASARQQWSLHTDPAGQHPGDRRDQLGPHDRLAMVGRRLGDAQQRREDVGGAVHRHPYVDRPDHHHRHLHGHRAPATVRLGRIRTGGAREPRLLEDHDRRPQLDRPRPQRVHRPGRHRRGQVHEDRQDLQRSTHREPVPQVGDRRLIRSTP